MTDCYAADVRSRTMAQVKATNTRPEVRLRKALWAIGIRGWRLHGRQLPGKPDLYFPRLKIAVFVDGAFWHGHPSKYKAGQSGNYWDVKISRNMERDRNAKADLEADGWRVLRLWDFDVMKSPEAAAHTVAQFIDTVSMESAVKKSMSAPG